MTTATMTPLPRPSRSHATCAWCRERFATIVERIDHVDVGHARPDTRAGYAPNGQFAVEVSR